jgi:hypothetical protein
VRGRFLWTTSGSSCSRSRPAARRSARRRARADDGTPLEYADDRYRPDRVRFTIDDARPASAGVSTDVRILKEIS